jgi:hypothetical protein
MQPAHRVGVRPMRRLLAASGGRLITVPMARAETLAADVECSGDALRVTLSDRRVVSVPLVWFPRLAGASTREQSEWELIGGGIGVHWEAIDEDVSVASLLRPENFMRLPDKALPPTARKKRAAAERRSR